MLAVIEKVLVYLRKRLDDYLRVQLAEAGDDPVAEKVVFFDGDKMDPISFQDGAVSELLINVEEERLLRAVDPYTRVQEDGKPLRKQPDLQLVLYVLFVARFKQYDLAWDHLAKIIEYLQSNRRGRRDDRGGRRADATALDDGDGHDAAAGHDAGVAQDQQYRPVQRHQETAGRSASRARPERGDGRHLRPRRSPARRVEGIPFSPFELTHGLQCVVIG
jgi:hypothetical protein